MIKNQYKKNGKWAKTPTLEELGYKIAKEKKQCNKCGYEWLPVLESGKCPSCTKWD